MLKRLTNTINIIIDAIYIILVMYRCRRNIGINIDIKRLILLRNMKHYRPLNNFCVMSRNENNIYIM